jgi:hypothetical protein
MFPEHSHPSVSVFVNVTDQFPFASTPATALFDWLQLIATLIFVHSSAVPVTMIEVARSCGGTRLPTTEEISILQATGQPPRQVF